MKIILNQCSLSFCFEIMLSQYVTAQAGPEFMILLPQECWHCRFYIMPVQLLLLVGWLSIGWLVGF